MFSKHTLTKRMLSCVLVLSLVLNVLLSTGIIPLIAWAADESESIAQNGPVYYVAGANGSDENDGSSADKAFATLAKAYEEISAEAVDYTTSTIVICGDVNMGDSTTTVATYFQYIGEHEGEVVITSKYGGVDYREIDPEAGLSMSNSWVLLGDTKLENISIKKKANTVYANYYSLHFGKGVDVSKADDKLFANTVILGTQSAMYYAMNEKFGAKDIVFTMESGAIGTLYGTGNSDQGWKNKASHKDYVPYNVNLNIMGGNITNLTAAANPAATPVANVTVTIGSEAVITNLMAKNDTVVVNGSTILEHKGVTGEKLAVAGFDTLKLTNASVTMSSLGDATKIQMRDDSRLVLTATPAAQVAVTITKASGVLNTEDALITAPAGTAEDVFKITNDDAAFVYASSDSGATWKLKEIVKEPTPLPEGNIFYVDGVGSGNKDGSSVENAFATLADAYRAIPVLSTRTTIVICGKVAAQAGANEAGNGGGTAEKTGYFNHWCLPQGSGKVVITSVCGDEDYRETAGLNLGGYWYLLNDTTFENINITGTATRLFANYNALYLGKGITGKTIASAAYLGTWVQVNGTGTNKYPCPVKDIVFTMESGTIGKLYGGGYDTQTYTGNATEGMNNTVTLNIAGGNITTLYGSGEYKKGKAHHENIAVNISGGKIGTFYGATPSATVYANVELTLSGGTVEAIYSCEDGATIYGSTVLNYQDVRDAQMAAAQGFDTLKLTNASVTAPAGVENSWSTITKLQMTDDSVFTLGFVPPSAHKVEVTMSKVGENWNTASAIIKATSGTANIFKVMFPLDHSFTYKDEGGASWTMKYTGLGIGTEGTPGEKLDVDLGLREDGSYTPLPEDATAYDTFLQKLEDLGAVKDEVNVISPVPVKGIIELYVDGAKGNDNDSGSKASPLKTINKALTYVEALQKMDINGIVVYLREGSYYASETIMLNAVHSGKNGAPVIISAYGDEEVVITSSANIPGSAFSPVTDSAIIDRLHDSVKDIIVQVDLKAMGVTELGSIGYGDLGGPNYQIYVNGNEYIPARYPNATNLWVGEVLDKGPIIGGPEINTNLDSTGVEFKMQDFRPTLWKNDGNIWLKGSMYAEWDIKNIRVAEIRRDSIKLDGGAEYGARSMESNTYYYYNILEELDVPGEYYVDLNTGIMYLYPVADMDKATVTYSGNANDLILLKGVENVVLNGLTIQNSTGNGIHMVDCQQTIVQNCTISRVGTGVYMDSCKKSGVIYSEISETANRPVEIIEEQKFFDYTPSLNFVQNCYIHSPGVKNPKFCAIYVRGTGNVVSHNLLQSGFSVAIYLQYAKECIVEYNEIVGSPTGTHDGGAIYIPSEGEGIHIRYNYIHDIGLFSAKHDPWSIYFDEGLSGCYAYGNVMVNVPGGFFSNGGSNSVVMNNVVMNTTKRAGSTYAIYGGKNLDVYTVVEKSRGKELKRYRQYLELTPEEQKAFRERYPLIMALFGRIEKALASETGEQTPGVYSAHGNYAVNNLIYNHGNLSFIGADSSYIGNRILYTNPFVDPEEHNFNLKDSINTSSWGFEYTALSMDKVGVLTNEKAEIGDFELLLPTTTEKANPYELQLRWSLAEGADTYEVKIAKNPEMTEDVRTITLVKAQLWFVEDAYFTYDSTYYWQVTAYSTAESRDVTPVSTEVMSFTTMTKEEYLDRNKADTMVIEGTIKDAEALAEEIQTNSEKYIGGTLEPLQAAIDIAKAAKDNRGYTQSDMNKANLELLNAIQEARSRKNVYKVNIDTALDKWSEPYLNKTDFTLEGDELKMHVTHVERCESIYGPGVDVREILCFKYKIDKEDSWNGFAIAQTNAGAFVTANTDAYLIVINPGQVELQKYQGGKQVVKIDVVIPADLFEGGVYCDIEIGAINNLDGSVGIHFKINDKLIFDPTVYIDTVADTTSTGTKELLVGAPITGCSNFGVVVNPINGDAYFMQADEDKLGLTDYKDPVVPDEPVNPDDPTEPTDPTEPVEPTDPTEPNNGEENDGFLAAITAFLNKIVALIADFFNKLLAIFKR